MIFLFLKAFNGQFISESLKLVGISDNTVEFFLLIKIIIFEVDVSDKLIGHVIFTSSIFSSSTCTLSEGIIGVTLEVCSLFEALFLSKTRDKLPEHQDINLSIIFCQSFSSSTSTLSSFKP